MLNVKLLVYHVTDGLYKVNRWIPIETDGTIVEKVYNINDLGASLSYEEKDIIFKIQTCNKMNGKIERYFGNCLTTDTKFRLHNFTLQTA